MENCPPENYLQENCPPEKSPPPMKRTPPHMNALPCENYPQNFAPEKIGPWKNYPLGKLSPMKSLPHL